MSIWLIHDFQLQVPTSPLCPLPSSLHIFLAQSMSLWVPADLVKTLNLFPANIPKSAAPHPLSQSPTSTGFSKSVCFLPCCLLQAARQSRDSEVPSGSLFMQSPLTPWLQWWELRVMVTNYPVRKDVQRVSKSTVVLCSAQNVSKGKIATFCWEKNCLGNSIWKQEVFPSPVSLLTFSVLGWVSTVLSCSFLVMTTLPFHMTRGEQESEGNQFFCSVPSGIIKYLWKI